MKLKSKKAIGAKKVLDTTLIADGLGKDYEAARERAASSDKIKSDIAAQIKAIAEEQGEREGNRCLIRGNRYVIGFCDTQAPQTVNWAAFAAKNPKLYASLLSPAVDEEKVALAIQDGRLPRKLLQRYLVQSGTPQRRIVVELAGKEDQNEDPS